MDRQSPRLNRRDLEARWLELTLLEREAAKLQSALVEAGLEVEAMSASIVVNGLAARVVDISKQLLIAGSDQPFV